MPPRRNTVIREQPYTAICESGGLWYARCAAQADARDADTRGPWPTRDEAIIFHDAPERSELRSWAEWQSCERPRPTLFDHVLIVGDSTLFDLAPSVRIDSFVKLEIGKELALGPGVHIASFCHIGIGGGTTILETGVACGSGAKIISGANVYGPGRSCSAVAPSAMFSRSFVRVCRNAVVFAGAIVLPGVTIGENAVIGAGAVVRDDVPPFEVWAGNPARFVKKVPR